MHLTDESGGICWGSLPVLGGITVTAYWGSLCMLGGWEVLPLVCVQAADGVCFSKSFHVLNNDWNQSMYPRGTSGGFDVSVYRHPGLRGYDSYHQLNPKCLSHFCRVLPALAPQCWDGENGVVTTKDLSLVRVKDTSPPPPPPSTLLKKQKNKAHVKEMYSFKDNGLTSVII